jgi:hypothetical protein
MKIGTGEIKENSTQLKIKDHVDLAGPLLPMLSTNLHRQFLKEELFQIFLSKSL